jgi:hypothetical protein
MWIAVFYEVELTLFASFSGKRRVWAGFQGPVAPFAENYVNNGLLRSRTNAFCFFFWKKNNISKPNTSFYSRTKAVALET